MLSTDSALVLFSGGQDSTTCLAWALQHYPRVETIGFDYGQRHAIELTVRPQLLRSLRGHSAKWDAKLGEDHMIDLSLISAISQTAMTHDIAIETQANGLPNTFVPGRNLLFMTVAATVASLSVETRREFSRPRGKTRFSSAPPVGGARSQPVTTRHVLCSSRS